MDQICRSDRSNVGGDVAVLHLTLECAERWKFEEKLRDISFFYICPRRGYHNKGELGSLGKLLFSSLGRFTINSLTPHRYEEITTMLLGRALHVARQASLCR